MSSSSNPAMIPLLRTDLGNFSENMERLRTAESFIMLP